MGVAGEVNRDSGFGCPDMKGVKQGNDIKNACKVLTLLTATPEYS